MLIDSSECGGAEEEDDGASIQEEGGSVGYGSSHIFDNFWFAKMS